METQSIEKNEIIMNPVVFNAASFAVSADVQPFVDAFTMHSRKTAVAIIEMAYIVFRAKRELGPIYYEQFKTKIHFDNNSSSYAKLEKIGERAEILKLYSESLPNSWTTLYHLSRLKANAVESLVKDGKIWEGMTGAEAMALVSPPKPDIPSIPKKAAVPNVETDKDNDRGFELIFDVLPEGDALRELHDAIKALILQSKIEASIHLSPSLESILFGETEVA